MGALCAGFPGALDLRRVVHLHRRAGFAATWDEIERDLKDGPEASINRLLEGRSRSYGVPANFAAFADRLAERRWPCLSPTA